MSGNRLWRSPELTRAEFAISVKAAVKDSFPAPFQCRYLEPFGHQIGWGFSPGGYRFLNASSTHNQ